MKIKAHAVCSAVGEHTADEVHAITCEEAEAVNSQMQLLPTYTSSKHALQVHECHICVVCLGVQLCTIIDMVLQ